MILTSFFHKHPKCSSECYYRVPHCFQVWHSSDSEVNVCSELDWKRCLAVHLWFMLPPTASVADALTRYEAAFKVSVTLWTHDFFQQTW